MRFETPVSLMDVTRMSAEIEAAVRAGALRLLVPTSRGRDKDIEKLPINPGAADYCIVHTDGE